LIADRYRIEFEILISKFEASQNHQRISIARCLRLPGLPFGLTQSQISQIWPFLIALGLEIFGLAFWLFFGLFGRVWH